MKHPDPPSHSDAPCGVDFGEQIGGALSDANDDGSHTERDAWTFHASQLGMCRRQMYLSKLGLKDMDPSLGHFAPGTAFHEWAEQHVAPRLRDAGHEVETEVPVVGEINGILAVGHADVVDHTEGVVYDYKTRKGLDERSGFETFEPSDRYVDQLTVYQYLAGMEWGQLVYVAKHDWAAVKQAPDCFSDDERRFFRYDGDRLQSVLERAHDVRDAILQDGFPSGPSEVPFDRCGCWVCENEDLRRDWILGDLDADFHTGTLRDALIRHRSSAGLSTDLEDAPERGDTEGSA